MDERNVIALAFVEAVQILQPLAPEQRVEVIDEVLRRYCEHCGEEQGLSTPHRCACFDKE
jgi:hypothetical protein